MGLRAGFNGSDIRERCKEVYDASGGNADLDLCGLCRGRCFKDAGYNYIGAERLKCRISYCGNEATVVGKVRIARSLEPTEMELCPEHAGLFITGELEQGLEH